MFANIGNVIINLDLITRIEVEENFCAVHFTNKDVQVIHFDSDLTERIERMTFAEVFKQSTFRA